MSDMIEEVAPIENETKPIAQSPLAIKTAAWFYSVNWELTLYILFVILALISRLWDVGARVMSHDESLHTQYSYQFFIGDGYQHTPLMHGPFLFHITAFSYWLFGATDFSARIPVALFGVLLVIFPYFFRDWLGKKGALFTSFLFLISPYISYYSRYIRHDIYVIIWALIVILAAWAYLHKREEKYLYWFAAGNALMFATKEVSFIYVAIIGSFIAVRLILQLLAAGWVRETVGNIKSALAVLALGILLIGIGGGGYLIQTRAVEETIAETIPPESSTAESDLVEAQAMRWVVVIGIAVLTAGLVLTAQGMRPMLDEYPEFDIIVLFSTLLLPAVSPLLVAIVGWNPRDYSMKSCAFETELTGFSLFWTKLSNTDCWSAFLSSGMIRTGLFVALTLLIAIYVGTWWNSRRWFKAAVIFHLIFAILYTSVFTNPGGWTSGMVGSLGYWLEQQEVQRGSQPWFYYLVVVPFYEFLPMLFALLAFFRWYGREIKALFTNEGISIRTEEGARHWTGLIPFLSWWTIMTWVAYTAAGEKMPWLSVHFTIPMGMMAGWYCQEWLRENSRSFFSRDSLRYWGLTTLTLIIGGTAFAQIWLGKLSFSEQTQQSLAGTGRFIGSLVLLGGIIYLLRQSAPFVAKLDRKRAWRFSLFALLAILTIRFSYMANFINADYTNEYMVYAHGAPATKSEVMAQVEELSMRMHGDKSIKVAFDNDSSWPFTWYLRDYPNRVYFGESPSRSLTDSPVIIVGSSNWGKVEPFLKDEYESYTYTFLWWPMEKYRDLNPETIFGDRNVDPEFRRGLGDAKVRQSLWDIFFFRDYTKYGETFGGTYSAGEWPLRHDLRLYIRHDTLATLWDYGAGAASIAPPVNPYAENGLTLLPDLIIGGNPSADLGQLNAPRNVAVAPDGTIFIADSGNNRIQSFDNAGNVITSWGSGGDQPGQFNEPWGITANEQFVFVADTWNHRVQQFTHDGTFVTLIGGSGSPSEGDIGAGLFFGPRDVTLLDNNFLLVTDTGNHRIQLFDMEGNFIRVLGGNGFDPGKFNEPVGLSVSQDGFLYVADTWNGRIQEFATDGDIYPSFSWDVDAWDGNSIQNKPYLANDSAGRIYVTDPEGFRILIFNRNGEYLARFGQFGVEADSLSLPNGIFIDANDNIYVIDANNHRLLRYPPLELP